MRELEETGCEIRSIVDIRHSVSNRLNNAEGDDGGSPNGSHMYSSLDSPNGGLLNDASYAWLSYGCHLVVINAKTGESTSSWTFRGKITCVCQFPAQSGELPLLLVGLDNEATRIKDSMGLLCVFDCTTSHVLRAIRMPAGVEQVCIVSGGAEWEEFNDKRPDNILMQMDGIACVVLRNLHHLMIDLQRSAWEVPDLSVLMDETSPAEIEFLTTKDSFHRNQSNKSKHMACNLLNRRIEKHIGFNREEFESAAFLDEKLTNTLISSTKIGCLISGCLGRVIIWQNDGSVGWISLPVDETMIITHLALLEPTDDPRPFYYLWVVFQDESLKAPPLLRMFALLFERKYCDRGTNLYFNLEAEPSLKFEFELDPQDRVVSLSTIEREVNPDQAESESKRGEDNLLLISTANRTLLFDLNQWYKEQMPQTVGECKNPNSILALYNTTYRNMASNEVISCIYIPRTLQEFPNNSLSLSEELFYPNSLSLEWVELSLAKLTFWLARGVQAELLREMALAGPIVLTQPSEMFHKCLSVGLVPFNTEVSFSSDHNIQRDMLLSLCLEQRWATFLIRCAKEWSDGSAAYMYPSFLKWGIQRASSIKMIADRLCVPLFDQSGNNIGESEVKTLRFCYQQLECLSNVVAKLPSEASNMVKQRRALKRVSMYFQVLLWFYDVGLLPESQELEGGPLPLSLALKIPYPYEKLFGLYREKRESVLDDRQRDESEEVLFIDELVTRECPALSLQWEREAGDTSTNGYYPPSSLQSLLRSYLTDCDQAESNEIECKHQITIYLLMDLAMLLQGSYPGIDQLIKYPSSFKMSPSLIKLTQAFWLLDHEDYHGFLDMMTGQLVCDSDVKDWHHKLVLRTLIRNSQHKLALTYLRVRKPPLSSVQDQSALIGLSVEHGLVQSAFHRRPQSHYAQLLLCFFQACKTYDKLGDILHLALDSEEEEMFVKFLEDSKSEDMRLLYYLQRCRYMEANSGSLTGRHSMITSKNMHVDVLNAYNLTLPDVVKRFSANIGKANLDADVEGRYPRPMTYNRSCQRTCSIYETVIKKARETYARGEKSVIPFITAPCTTLRLNDDRVNINCVMSPKVVQANRKRTLDEVQDEEDSGMRTPDRAKRRKLLDDGEAALNAAFSTPLVKRKVCSNRDMPIETPHSILKIRQLIRNSTSPTISTLQSEIIDNSDKKINRQIRFSIGQSKNNSSHGDHTISKLNVSGGSEEVFLSPQSITESAVLSESSYTCKNVYTARPRPSLRRTCLQASAELAQDKSSTNSGLAGTPTEDCSKISTMVTPQSSRRCTSMLSSTIYSPAILSPDSSFETSPPLRRSNELDPPFIFAKQQDTSIKSSVFEESLADVDEPMVVDKEEEVVELESSREDRQQTEVNKQNHLQLNNSDKLNESVHSKYKNGDISKNNLLGACYEQEKDTSCVENRDEVDNEEEFKSFSNSIENNSVDSERRESRSWCHREKSVKGLAKSIQDNTDLRNGEHFDITDDESSKSGDEMVLALDESDKKLQHPSKMSPAHVDNVYGASNITDDESDSSIDINEPDRKSIAPPSVEKSVRKEPKFSIMEKKNVTEYRKRSIFLDNNNSDAREEEGKPVQGSPERLEPKGADTSNTEAEHSAVNESVTPKMVRSRRASSVAKEASTPPVVSSPSKVAGKTPRSKRASSLAKEVLTASIADESVKQTGSSGSEGTSLSRGPRGRRASSLAKDSPSAEDEEAKVSVRRSTRRATSVQKELPEPVKPLTKSRRTSLSTSFIMDNEDEKVQVDTVKSKAKNSTPGERRPSISRLARESIGTEEVEEPSVVKPRRRCSSVPKETVDVAKSLRSSSVAREIIPEDSESLVMTPKGRHSIAPAVNSPAANTRSRRSSIQSIPEELEEILSVPLKERISTAGNKKQSAQSSRQRRAASVEPLPVEAKRKTRNTRAKSILKETIVEEEVAEAEDQAKVSNSKKVPTRRKRASSDAAIREIEDKAVPKPRRNRKTSTKEEADDKFSFSQPDRTSEPPSDQKAIGEVPSYVFSPPHTRSKTAAPDHRE
ncbi:AT hook containing transcription factor 1 homolog isoform X2 [Andrena cerasifolii]|uniref:AT hook containing transcription factor 1 homolog isoform X2 n=1 Tax=Andrena cerasifolii TaxID=2819439 RepID=UPI0040378820